MGTILWCVYKGVHGDNTESGVCTREYTGTIDILIEWSVYKVVHEDNTVE